MLGRRRPGLLRSQLERGRIGPSRFGRTSSKCRWEIPPEFWGVEKALKVVLQLFFVENVVT